MIGFVSFNHSVEQFSQFLNYYIFLYYFVLKKESFFLYSEEYLIPQFNCIWHKPPLCLLEIISFNCEGFFSVGISVSLQ